jgi:hypothetical protein
MQKKKALFVDLSEEKSSADVKGQEKIDSSLFNAPQEDEYSDEPSGASDENEPDEPNEFEEPEEPEESEEYEPFQPYELSDNEDEKTKRSKPDVHEKMTLPQNTRKMRM